MPKLLDEFDLDLQKVNEISPMSTDGGNTLAICNSSGPSSAPPTGEFVSALICSITCPSNNEHCK